MRFWPILQKDLLILRRDRRTLTLLLVMPLVFIGILGFSAAKVFMERQDQQILLSIVDADRSPLSRKVIARFASNAVLQVETVDDLEEARRHVRREGRTALLVIGPGFSRAARELELIDLLDFPRGRFAGGLQNFDIRVYSRSVSPGSRDAIEQLLFYEVLYVLVPDVINRLALVKSYVEAYRAQHPLKKRARNPALMSSFFKGLIPSTAVIYQTLVPAYAVMFAFFLVNIMAYSFVSERKKGTLQRMRAGPVRRFDLIVGKTAPFWIVSVIQGLVLFASGHFLFGMPWGARPWMLLPLIVCTSAAATGLGLLVATLVETEAQVTTVSTLLVITLAALSGCLMPRVWMPGVVRTVSLFVAPLSWSLVGYSEVLAPQGPEGARVLECCLMLLLFALVFFFLGVWRFRRQARGAPAAPW